MHLRFASNSEADNEKVWLGTLWILVSLNILYCKKGDYPYCHILLMYHQLSVLS